MSGTVVASIPAHADSAQLTRVLVVDDSAVIRGVISRWLSASGQCQIVGSLANGKVAVEQIKSLNPDVVILDIEMPEMDGITALPQMLRACPNAKIIMASTLSKRNAEISLKALALGATDYIPKPSSLTTGDASEDFRKELIAKINAFAPKKRAAAKASPALAASPNVPARPGIQTRVTTAAAPVVATVKGQQPVLRKGSMFAPQIVAIGSSTGGPQALLQVIAAIAPRLNVPVVITQHMPATFTTILAEMLARSSKLKCVEGTPGLMLERGHVYIAPGDYHMTIKGKGGPIELNQQPPENFCRPAVDPMFRSIAAAYGPAALAVVLTGMGSDGRDGARAIANAGGTILAQDEATSVVWGMPGAVAQAGLASAILPVQDVGAEVRRLLGLQAK